VERNYFDVIIDIIHIVTQRRHACFADQEGTDP